MNHETRARFIETLHETAKGEQREGFDIRLYDAEWGEDESVTAMSGGERVWVNECLVRAVALYLAQNTGRRYGTLFTDETDGPLDPHRNRGDGSPNAEHRQQGREGCQGVKSGAIGAWWPAAVSPREPAGSIANVG